MVLKQITPDKLNLNVIEAIGKDWMLITAGTQQSFNMMTASWGFAGFIWGLPAAGVVVRPSRYTKEFIDETHAFTLSFFPDKYKKILTKLGTDSGRDMNKMSESGLTPIQLPTGDMSYEEAKTTIACRVMYAQPLARTGFMDPTLMPKWYPLGESDLHTLYIGEIQAIYEKEKSGLFG